jgi:transposase
VESRRVNGKPRPIILEYLGKAEDLLQRLQAGKDTQKIKSYSHGAVGALLSVARDLDVVELINQHIDSPRPYFAKKPLRHGLTAGATLLLGALGRVCRPTSKMGWVEWARKTTCGYLLRVSLAKVDSQHFWDLMDALPVESIPLIEEELLRRVREKYGLEGDTLFYDATNFFTFIATDNKRCHIAQRGKNKQKRGDLRQVGLAMMVTRPHMIPIFHLSYQGNLNDATIFKQLLGQLVKRIEHLGFDPANHTLVFDQGNNSRENLAQVEQYNLHYVGALSPSQHQGLVTEALNVLDQQRQPGEMLPAGSAGEAFRARRQIWGASRTVVVFISEKLRTGHLRGFLHSLEKKTEAFRDLQRELERAEPGKLQRQLIEYRIEQIVKGQFMSGIFHWTLQEQPDNTWRLKVTISDKAVSRATDLMGLRMIMTNRHDWTTEEIIQAYHGQSHIEEAFKNVKDHFHLSFRPQYHWTDQKIIVHNFICFLGYLLIVLIWRTARLKASYAGTLPNMISRLCDIRLAVCLEKSQEKRRGRQQTRYVLEDTTPEEKLLLETLGLEDLHRQPLKIKGVGVYR